MSNSSIISSIREEYIDENLESAKKIDYQQLTAANGLETVFYKDLANTEMKGYPIASDYVAPNGKAYSVTEFNALPEQEKKKCDLRYYYLPTTHELYVGTTGSGKTTGCVEPQLRAITSQKNKPHLFFTDPKGELFNRNAQHIKDQGYELFVMNFKDTTRSDRWNPLLDLYDTKLKIKTFGKNCKMHIGKVKKGLALAGNPEDFTDDGYIEYEGKAFPNGDSFNGYIDLLIDGQNAEVSSMINEFATMMVKSQNERDSSWDNGAQELFKGVLYCMLEDAVDPDSGFTRDMMNLRMINEYYQALRVSIVSQESAKIDTHHLLRNKSRWAKQLLSTALDSAKVTMQGFCSTFEGNTKDWFQGHIFSLTTGNTIDIESVNNKPFAIFLITRDYEKSDFIIAGLFVDWLYKQMLKKAESFQLTRAMHFILDEFGNIPKIKDLDNKIATARSRNIWFHLFVQSYKQIDIIYGADRSVVIRDNCNTQIFLGAQNTETKEIFSRECGKHYIPTLESKLNPNDNSIREAPLVPISELDLICPGQMYVKRLYMPLITSQFIRSYVCALNGTYRNYLNATGLSTCTKVALEPFTSPKFSFAKLYETAKEKDKGTLKH